MPVSSLSRRGLMALKLAQSGRPVFPCIPNGKRPATPRGLLDASTDLKQIVRYWTAHPEANVGLRCGQPSGVVVLDVDGQEGADALWELEHSHAQLPATTTVVTPRGGAHYYFEWPGVAIKTTAGVIGPGLDCRADGGFVLVPESATADGAYVWDRELPLAPMPPWLVGLCRAHVDQPPAPASPSTWTAMLQDGIPEGRRNVDLARLTGHFLRRWLDVDLAAELIHLVNQASCRPPLSGSDVETIIDSISSEETRRLREQGR